MLPTETAFADDGQLSAAAPLQHSVSAVQTVS